VRISSQKSCGCSQAAKWPPLGSLLMSALGQKQTWRFETAMSAIPPKADIVRRGGNVRFVPEADIGKIIRLLCQRVQEMIQGSLGP
jgi:hypothetical protein